jgi:ATP/maltotriose-dependent transcriptional regulator MalT
VEERFVGRVGETARLDHHFDLATGRQGQLVLLVGPSGIGKTSLIRHCLAQWGARTVWISGDPIETTLAGGLLDQLCNQLHLSSDPFEDERSNPLAAGKTLLDALATGADHDDPLVVVIDDANWADDLSLKALTFAFRRLQARAVLGIVVTRPEAVFHLPGGLRNAAVDHGTRIDLEGLTLEDVGQLAEAVAGTPFNGRAVRRLHAHTDGLPLHVRELLHDLPVSSFESPGTSLPAPRSVDALVLSRLARCTRETERLVVAVAVLGDRCRLVDAAALAELPDSLPALQEAEREGLLVQVDATEGRLCRFAHSLLRAAVYRDIGAARRAELHRRAVDLTSGSAALDHRVSGCVGTDPVLADDLEAQAEEELARDQGAEAVRELLASVKVDPSSARRDRRLLRAVGLLLDLGDVARAREYLPDIIAMESSAERTLMQGRLAMLSGNHDEAERRLTQAWDHIAVFSDASRDQAAQAACDLALLLLGHQHLTDATQWAGRAVSLATGSLAQACAQVLDATCAALAGDLPRARTALEALVREDDRGPAQLLLRAGLGNILLWADDLVGAGAHLAVAIAPAGTPHFPLSHRLIAQVCAIQVDYRRGRWSEASRSASELLTVIEDFDQQWLVARANASAALPLAARGEWERASAHIEKAMHGEDVGGAGYIDIVNARAALAFAQDDPCGVREAVAPLHDALSVFENVEPSVLGFWPLYAHAMVRQGDLDTAEQVLTPFERLARGRDRSSALGAAARVRACLEAARKQDELAEAAFAVSLDHFCQLSMPFEEALTRLEHGRFLRRLGQRRAAVRELSAARLLLLELDAAPYLRTVDNELGAEPHPSEVIDAAGDGRSPLTRRQLMVAEAVIAGKTNRQIAGELYVSIKTVEFHLSQILTRLGVDSRSDIEGALRAHGVAH